MAGAGAAVPPETILAGEAVEWEYGMRRDMQEIIPNIFLGPYACAMKKKLAYLQEHHITHIVCVRQHAEAHFVRANFPQHFQYLVVDISDGNTESIIPHFPRVREFLKAALAAGGKILMHGNAGISRSGALLVSFMMEQYALSYTDALRLIQLRRFCVSPNEGFQAQLLEYEPIYQAAAMRAQGQIQNQQARPKRGIDETESADDDEEDYEDRNPAAYPPAIELPPLPGHGAYCGPEAVARQAAEKLAKQQQQRAAAQAQAQARAAGGGGGAAAAGFAAAAVAMGGAGAGAGARAGAGAGAAYGGTGRPNTAAAMQAQQVRQQQARAVQAQQQQLQQQQQAAALQAQAQAQQHQQQAMAHARQQQHQAGALQAQQQQQQQAAAMHAHQQQQAMAMHAHQQQQQHAMAMQQQQQQQQGSFAQQAAAFAVSGGGGGGGAGGSSMDSGSGL